MTAVMKMKVCSICILGLVIGIAGAAIYATFVSVPKSTETCVQEKKSLTDRLTEAQSTSSGLEGVRIALSTCDKEKKSLTDRLTEAQTASSGLDGEKTALKSTCDQEKKSLTDRLTEAQSTSSKLDGEKTALTAAKSACDQEKKSLTDRLAQAQTASSGLEGEKTALTAAKSACDQEKKTLIDRLAQAQTASSGLEGERIALTSAKSAFETEKITFASAKAALETEKATVANERTLASAAVSMLEKLFPDFTKVNRYWGCIMAADTPIGYKWATTDAVVGPKLKEAGKIGLQAQMDVVRDNIPTAIYVAFTQSYLYADSLYTLWHTEPPTEKKIDGRNKRCLLPAKDGYVGCKSDTPVIGCLNNTEGGVTWTVYKIR